MLNESETNILENKIQNNSLHVFWKRLVNNSHIITDMVILKFMKHDVFPDLQEKLCLKGLKIETQTEMLPQ